MSKEDLLYGGVTEISPNIAECPECGANLVVEAPIVTGKPIVFIT
jgi:hypothetical protein